MSNTKMETFPFVEVPGVNNYLLNFMMVYLLPIDSLKELVSSEKKVQRQLNQQMKGEEIEDVQYLLHVSEIMSTNYNIYNLIANILYNKLVTNLQDELDEFLRFETVDKACEWLFEGDNVFGLPDIDICEWITFLRLYKKGKFAEAYIPVILKSSVFLFNGETSLKMSDFTEEDDWKERAYESYLEQQKFLSLNLQQEEQELTFSGYKDQIINLLELMEESIEDIDPETIQKLEEANEMLLDERAELENELSEVNKKLKSKDSQIQKLQREIANITKSQDALQKRYDDLKTQNGVRDQEIGQLRKGLQEATQKLETSEKSVKRLKDEQQSNIDAAEKVIENRFNKEIAEIRITHQEEVDKLLIENEHLTKELESIQEQMNEATSAQTIIAIYKSEINNLKQLVEHLQNENRAFQLRNEQILKSNNNMFKSNELINDEELIDEKIMDELLISKPSEEEEQKSQFNSFFDEDNFADLFSENKPK